MKEKLLTGALALTLCGVVFGSIALARAWAAAPSPTLLVSAPLQPASSLALPGALRVPFTAVRLTATGGDIVVAEMTVRQSGIAADEVFESVLVLDEQAEPLTGEETLKDGTVLFRDILLIPKGTSRTIMVAGNMAEDLSEFEGQQPALSIVDIRAEALYPVRL